MRDDHRGADLVQKLDAGILHRILLNDGVRNALNNRRIVCIEDGVALLTSLQ